MSRLEWLQVAACILNSLYAECRHVNPNDTLLHQVLNNTSDELIALTGPNSPIERELLEAATDAEFDVEDLQRMRFHFERDSAS